MGDDRAAVDVGAVRADDEGSVVGGPSGRTAPTSADGDVDIAHGCSGAGSPSGKAMWVRCRPAPGRTDSW
jgi:hypothetical protein